MAVGDVWDCSSGAADPEDPEDSTIQTPHYQPLMRYGRAGRVWCLSAPGEDWGVGGDVCYPRGHKIQASNLIGYLGVW